MNKELQQKWDTLLMRGWLLEKSMGWVAYQFFDKKIQDGNTERLIELGIKRSFHMASRNVPTVGFKVPVRAYVDTYCKELSDKLWSGEPPIMHVFNLDDFEWKNLDHKIKLKGKATRNRASRNKRRTKHLPLIGGELHESRYGWTKTK